MKMFYRIVKWLQLPIAIITTIAIMEQTIAEFESFYLQIIMPIVIGILVLIALIMLESYLEKKMLEKRNIFNGERR